MKKILISSNKATIVDDNFFDILSKFKWSYSGHGYASRCFTENGKSIKIYLHQCVLGKPINRKLRTDHINGNRLDNRRENLRIVTARENNQNKRSHRHGRLLGFQASGGKKNPWQAVITIDGKIKHLGVFRTQEEAHACYMQACQKLNNQEQQAKVTEQIKII